MASNVPSLQTLALRAMRAEPRGIVGHSQRLRRERAWLVSSGRLLRMPGNWTDRNVAEFLGPGHLFRYLVKKMLTMRDYVKEMIKALAERNPGQLSLSQGRRSLHHTWQRPWPAHRQRPRHDSTGPGSSESWYVWSSLVGDSQGLDDWCFGSLARLSDSYRERGVARGTFACVLCAGGLPSLEEP